MRREMRTGLACVVFGVLSFFVSGVCVGQDSLRYPLPGTPLLSGNFFELRGTHFHAGLDFKTGGKEGLPVICVKDGYLARVCVSPTGYGNALYLAHEGGITTVYGHLRRFVPRVARLVRDMQYRKESFAVDTVLLADSIFFHAGDTIAYSGNTGSSGGPHLHFEIRDTESESILNPQRYLFIPDETAPTVRGVYVYAFRADGVCAERRLVGVKNKGGRRYAAGRVAVPAGRVGLGVHADDFMKGSWNKLGLHTLTVWAAGRKIFHLRADSSDFSQSRWINAVKDFDLYREGKTVYRTFGHYQSRVRGTWNSAGGCVIVPKDSLVPVRLELTDVAGHRSVVELELLGRDSLPAAEGEKVLEVGKEYRLEAGGYTLYIYDDILPEPLAVEEKLVALPLDSVRMAEGFQVTPETRPLLGTGRLEARGNFPPRSVICLYEGEGRLSALATARTAEGVSASVGVLGTYVVVRDTVPPSIVYRGKSKEGNLRFRISDDLSGISTYRVEVNGRWCLFRYDPKFRLLEGSVREPVFQKGENRLTVRLTDRAGNVATWERTIAL